MDSDELSQGNFEVGFRPQQSVKAGRDRQPEAQPQGGGLARGAEAESQPPRPPKHGLAVSPAPVGMPSCSPGWCSAFYEADCFGADVHSYVQELAGQKGPRDPAANAQSPVSPMLVSAWGAVLAPCLPLTGEWGVVLGPARRGPRGRVPARAPRSHLLPRPPCWVVLPLFASKGGCAHLCAPPTSEAGTSFSLFGLLVTKGRLAGGHLALGATARFGQQGQHHEVRSIWPVVVSLARPQGGFSGGQHTLCAPPGQGQPRLLPGQQGDGRPWTGVSRPGQPACRAAPQSSEPKVSAWPLGVCPFMTRSPDCSLPSQVTRAPTPPHSHAGCGRGGQTGWSGQRPGAPLPPPRSPVPQHRPATPSQCPHLATQPQERASPTGSVLRASSRLCSWRPRVVCVLSCAGSVTPGTVTRQAPLSMGLSRQEHWSGQPHPPQGSSHPGTEPASPVSCTSGRVLYRCTTWEPVCTVTESNREALRGGPPNPGGLPWQPLNSEPRHPQHLTKALLPH